MRLFRKGTRFMSSPKTKKVKSSSKAKPAAGEQAHQEPTRDEKAAFVKAMLHGIQPGTRAAKVMAEKKAQKLMTESSNMFEELIKKFHIKYGKLQI